MHVSGVMQSDIIHNVIQLMRLFISISNYAV